MMPMGQARRVADGFDATDAFIEALRRTATGAGIFGRVALGTVRTPPSKSG